MDRLTVPDEPIEGGTRRRVIDARAVKECAMEIYWKLKSYEDTGLTPKEITDGKWIPVTWHERTKEELEEGFEYPIVLDCPLPDDRQEILVCSKKYVWIDECCVDDGYSLDSGNDWVDDVVAWMPLPKPYKPE